MYIAKYRYKVRPIAIYRYTACENDMQIDLDDIIKALAHPVRREILTWLKDPRTTFPAQEHSIEHGVCAGQIDQRAGLSQSTVSAHLATLQRAGLISSKKVGQWHFFRRNEEVIEAFVQALIKELNNPT
ncbi:ArsR family transcriptional regulator [Pseudomonas syringae pv. actinidiae]|nr:ArsR family transcriptional regulator [Pseudomonas syringae pv. actinidiae]GBH12613.1 DNA-binding transcriptional regulator [Pseudomonas syringae pv. actinidiae]GBH19739.1 DNA-binding transcriptional regulator [Pseudomonas syringae pv. actinidiae]